MPKARFLMSCQSCRDDTDTYIARLLHLTGTSRDGGTGSGNIVDEQDMLAAEELRFDKGEGMVDILVSLYACLVGLRIGELSAVNGFVDHWQTGNGADATDYLSALVVATAALTVARQGHGHHGCNIVEEACFAELAANIPSELKSIVGPLIVLQTEDYV